MQLFVTGPTWRRGWMPARSSICPGWPGITTDLPVFTFPAGITSVSLLPPGLTALRQ